MSIRLLLFCSLVACGGVQRTSSPMATSATGDSALDPGRPAPAAGGPAASYRQAVGKILDAALADNGAWHKLSHLTDRVGARLSGSPALNQAISWAVATLKADGHENVRAEKVMVPHWVRGAESAALVAPVARSLTILGLGGTVGTPPGGVTGEVVVVRSFEQLAELGSAGLEDKIVLYDVPMHAWSIEKGAGYDKASPFRVAGPSAAAKHGAAAVLVRSLTAHSLNTPHTGTLWYADGPRIPAAAVTIEDAELMVRLIEAGDSVRVNLQLGARQLPDAPSANVVAELVGRDKPEEIVVLAAHIDSWDVGQGAHDDGTGCAIVMQALAVLRRLDLRPRRTVRVVLYTNEENGLRGATGYVEAHEAELANHVMAIESDSGGFAPLGFEVSGSDAAVEQVREIAQLLAPIGATRVRKGYSGADIKPLEKTGTVGLGLWVDETEYFHYHHTAADTLDKVDPGELARGVAAVAALAYVVAELPDRLGAE